MYYFARDNGGRFRLYFVYGLQRNGAGISLIRGELRQVQAGFCAIDSVLNQMLQFALLAQDFVCGKTQARVPVPHNSIQNRSFCYARDFACGLTQARVPFGRLRQVLCQRFGQKQILRLALLAQDFA
jgi:hypothetical protein